VDEMIIVGGTCKRKQLVIECIQVGKAKGVNVLLNKEAERTFCYEVSTILFTDKPERKNDNRFKIINK